MAIFVHLCAIKFLPRDLVCDQEQDFVKFCARNLSLLRQSKRYNIVEFYLDLKLLLC